MEYKMNPENILIFKSQLTPSIVFCFKELFIVGLTRLLLFFFFSIIVRLNVIMNIADFFFYSITGYAPFITLQDYIPIRLQSFQHLRDQKLYYWISIPNNVVLKCISVGIIYIGTNTIHCVLALYAISEYENYNNVEN